MTMQPIEKQVHDAFEIVSLEKLWDEQLECDIEHADTGVPCAVVATHRMFSCVPSGFICTPAAEHQQRLIADPKEICVCEVPCADHWRIEPI